MMCICKKKETHVKDFYKNKLQTLFKKNLKQRKIFKKNINVVKIKFEENKEKKIV